MERRQFIMVGGGVVAAAAVGAAGSRVGSGMGTDGQLVAMASSRGLSGDEARGALQTAVPPGKYDPYYMLVALLGMFGVGTADPASAATPQNASATASASASVTTTTTASLTTSAKAPGITITGVEAGGLMELTVTLTGPDGQPLADAPVEFLFSTTQFGTPARLVQLGSVTTDKTGLARLTLGGDADHLYRPTAKGPQEFFATYAAAGAKPVTASTIVNVTVARSAYTPAPPKSLAGVGNVLIVVLFAIVAAIWLTLVAQIWRIRRVCRVVKTPTSSTA